MEKPVNKIRHRDDVDGGTICKGIQNNHEQYVYSGKGKLHA